MNWQQVEGQWQQLTGSLKSRWGKLTDNDLANVAGKKDQLIGNMQERYGHLKEVAEKQLQRGIAHFLGTLDPDDKPHSVKPPG